MNSRTSGSRQSLLFVILVNHVKPVINKKLFKLTIFFKKEQNKRITLLD